MASPSKALDPGDAAPDQVALPLGGLSPSMDVLAVAAALASRGHNVSVVVPQDDIPFSRSAASRHGGGDGADLLEWIAYDMPFTVNSEVMRDMAARVKGVRNPLRVLANLMEVMGRPCSLMFSNATLMAALESGRYEAVLTFNMPGDWADSCGCVLAHSLGVPLMTVHGIPFITAPLSVPQFGSGLDDQALATWRGRTRNLLSFMMTRTMSAVTGIVSRRSMAGIRRQRRLPRGPASQGRACAPMLQLDANSFHLDPPRPLGPPHALIGPIAPRFARPSLEPPEVAAFVDSAPAGVAVVSFGSAPIFGTFLTRKDFLELSLAFADLAPTRVVWLLKPRNMPDDVSIGELPLGDNTITAPWVSRS
ncbi:hypothetical protein MNEG_3644 [Monoraphidium neglectum]|uniref:Uncharacterized protein n=1 Tax=Monoraphidium neglectum TaxID=145388 RepID=A0A0D2LC30_9CHLO|nr:hypothetical protein MNEG_3644 [Monoraphidium neglectum]KIZ04309.1 hypothetical protein MNEG_3644 [Monoraphidium neglectum]|eukprot:XP_013903328.1 hypothetical protein MNEG_3644 [Monoraphidium neglectum]